MNAVARTVVSDNTFVRETLISFNLPELKILVMVFLLLISALGMVYVKDLNRRLFIMQHKLQAQSEQLQSDSSKLLLEQSAWAAQARVQMVAQRQLQMQIPLSGDVVVIKT
ncbi:MAG: cell division protein FtsL [uncultured bacterium]|nr:MAG: cell division protein FtsL [uncultured bacterium]